MATTRVKWIEDKSFLGIGSNGRSVVMSPGDGPGVSPMQMLLLGLGGCTAIDIVDILGKQRQPLEDLQVEISGERGEEWPKPWTRVHIRYVIVGAQLDPHKVARAVELSVHKYCGAHATLAGVAEITHDYTLCASLEAVVEA
ncbi:MAG: OsmC family protein [Caldilineaceae bacterium]|nr:OsmC family protein [Caldilineaceae bacterium]